MTTGNFNKICVALFLVLLVSTQFRESQAGMELKLKKLLKKYILLKALSPKKTIKIIPLPLPLSLPKKEDMMMMDMMMPMEKLMPMSMPMQMPIQMPMPMPMPMPIMMPAMGNQKMLPMPAPSKSIMMPRGQAMIGGD